MTPPDPHDPNGEPAPAPRLVRPYTLTAGRTTATVNLPMEATLVRRERRVSPGLSAAAQRVLETCHQHSVAEVSALTKMPIGVARVLLSDLVEQGYVQVQATITEDSSRDERIELIERTLRGLRTY